MSITFSDVQSVCRVSAPTISIISIQLYGCKLYCFTYKMFIYYVKFWEMCKLPNCTWFFCFSTQVSNFPMQWIWCQQSIKFKKKLELNRITFIQKHNFMQSDSFISNNFISLSFSSVKPGDKCSSLTTHLSFRLQMEGCVLEKS